MRGLDETGGHRANARLRRMAVVGPRFGGGPHLAAGRCHVNWVDGCV